MSQPRIELHPDAIAEGRAAHEWYEARSRAAADAFLDELDRAIARIGEDPELHPVYIYETRRYQLKRFPFFIVFRATATCLQVIAIAHGKRKPGYWRLRLSG